MGITGIIALILLTLLILTTSIVISGIKQRNWKKIVLPIIAFAAMIGCVYLALVSFITSM